MATAAQDHAITELLAELREGSPGAMDRLVPLVYADLARIAHRQLGLEPAGHTLATAELVHEAYLRLVDQTRAQWTDRRHFFAVAAHIMRRILVDHARRHHAARRGGAGRRPVPLEVLESEGAELSVGDRADVILAIDRALEGLGALSTRLVQVVECRFFAGLTEEETAEVLEVTARTVARDWVKARGWLYQALCDEPL